MIWEDASTSTYNAERTTVNGHTVIVCLDDEGPLHPAFYWEVIPSWPREVDNRKIDGWARTVERARKDAVKAAKEET